MTASASSRIAMQFPFSSQPCGIVFSAAGKRAATYLPLETAEIHADIVDGEHPLVIAFKSLGSLITHWRGLYPVSALITVTHKFWQYSPTKLPQAKYVFPVPARAAVCGFEMTSESGVVIVAVAKEKEQAKREYDAALRQGRMAGLLEHVTDDGERRVQDGQVRRGTNGTTSILVIPWGSSSTPTVDDQNNRGCFIRPL